MGFAASQARYLLLTARKSDLEFRAQQITNSEMILAMQTEEIAREYSMKLSNQTIRYQTGEGGIAELTAANFNALTGLTLQELGEDGQWHNWQANNTKTYVGLDGSEIDEETYNALSSDEKGNYSLSQEIGGNYNGLQLLQGFNNQTLRVVNAAGEEQDFINANTNTVVGYDTSDDAAADAEYRQKTAALQVKEKRLQMELQQVEAQQKACETEIDSVKKIMDKNIDRTFKVFS